MRRRDFFKLLGGAVLLPQMARAQSGPRTPRLGILGVTVASSWASRLEALRSGLRRLGYEQDKNIVIEDLWAEENYNRLPALAAELVRRKVDIILTYGTPGTLAAKRATTEIPIVFVTPVTRSVPALSQIYLDRRRTSLETPISCLNSWPSGLSC
jgi:putative ABC transport system substrate-binding protein